MMSRRIECRRDTFANCPGARGDAGGNPAGVRILRAALGAFPR